MPKSLDDAFSVLPKGLRGPLLKQYRDALAAAQNADWEKVGSKAGKLCEIIYSIVKGHVDGAFPTKPSKPANMVRDCTALEQADQATFPRSIRIQIPRVLIAVYELRNNRDIGHVGSDVDPNEMDGEFFLRSIKWLVAELLRIFHTIKVEEAASLVDAVSERTSPLIWRSGDGIRIRVLKPKWPKTDQALLALHGTSGAMSRAALCDAVQHSNPSAFKKDVVQKLHKRAYVDFDPAADTVTILPLGTTYIEQRLSEEK